MFLDQAGLITQSNGDGGDKLQREGFFYEGERLNAIFPVIPGMASYRQALTILADSNGNLRRDQVQYTDAHDVSRDQLVSNIRACGYFGYTDVVKNCLKNVVLNFSRYPNNDIAFLTDYARFARALNWWWSYPLLILFDFFMLVNSIIRIVKGRNYDDVGDDVNHIGDLAQCSHTYPTFFSWFARWTYARFRPHFSIGTTDHVTATRTPGPGPAYALIWYFRPESGANPEFATLWIPIVSDW